MHPLKNNCSKTFRKAFDGNLLRKAVDVRSSDLVEEKLSPAI